MTMTNVHLRNRKSLPNGASDVADRKRCVIYLRVSSREQADEGYSISAQREACRRLIEDRGWTLVDEYVDAGESARTADRPAFRTLLDRLSEDPVDCLVVHKLDRLARNLEDHVAVRAKLRKAGVELISVTESLEESASGKLVEGILASIAEFYSANLSQEIRKGLTEKARQGGWPGRAPIGYRNIRLERNGRRGEAIIVPDTEQAAFVRQAFELYATGEWPLAKLHDEMSRRGLRTRQGTVIALSKLAEALKNRAYIGKVVWNGIEYEGIHEPLVSPELFASVQSVFELHDRAGGRQRRHNNYLRGTLFCATCGSRLSITVAKGRFPYFFCLGARGRRTDCRQPYVPTEEIELQVEELYRRIRLPRRLREEIEHRLHDEIAARQFDRARAGELWRRRLKRLDTEREKLLRAHYAGVIDLELFDREQKRIRSEVAQAKVQLEATDARLAREQETLQLARRLAANLYRAYRTASPLTRRRYNHAFFSAIFICDRRTARVDYRESFDKVLRPGRERLPREQIPMRVSTKPVRSRPIGNANICSGDTPSETAI